MTTLDLLAELRRLDVNLRLDGDRLRFDAPPGVMTDALRATLRDHKDALVEWMRRASAARAADEAIPRVDRRQALPASFAQRRMWFLQQLAPDSPLYNMTGAVRLSGVLEAAALTDALSDLQRRHEVLRTTFELRGNEPVQVVRDDVASMPPVADLATLPEAARQAALDEIADAWSRAAFDLEAGPLFRVRLVRLAPDEHVLLLAFHHSVCDGWSIGVFVRDLGELYAARLEGRAPALPPLPVQYADYAAWQRARLTDEVVERDLAFWRLHLGEGLPAPESWGDRPRPDSPSFAGALHQFAVPAATAAALDRVAQREGSTLFMTLLAAYVVWLFRVSSQRDIVVGTPVAGRDRAELEPLIGCFVNSLALRTQLDGGQSFTEVVAAVRATCLSAFEHQDVPLERIVEDLRLDRHPALNPLYQVMFSLQTGGGATLSLPGLTVTPMEARATTARVDLTLSMSRTASGLAGLFEYSTDLFDAETIERLGRTFVTLLGALAASPAERIDSLSLADAAERAALAAGSRGAAGPDPVGPSLGQRLLAVAAAHPAAIAIEDGATRVTYAALATQARALAGGLRALGVGPNVVVGVWQARGADLWATVAGIAVAGGAYLPVEPHQPAARAAQVLAAAGTRVVVTTAALLHEVPAGPWQVVLAEDLAGPGPPVSEAPGTSADLAYVLFTSGSTGTPKGVAVPQAGVVRLVVGTDYVTLGPSSVIGQAATAAFDAATFEVWGAWLHGGRLVVLPPAVAVAPAALGAYLQRTGVTTLFLTTALVHQIGRETPGALAGLDTLLFGGEAVEPKWVAAIQAAGGPRRILHVYGPTEHTTFSTWGLVGPVPAGASTLSIGGPIAQSTCWVEDAAGTLAAVGVPGELLVGGPGLAWGYLGNPRLTAERFVPDGHSGAVGARLYRTGDIVRWTAPGQLRFVGRRDGQVKLRGFRIELGEVETALRAVPGVADAVVIVDGTSLDRRLVAYITPAPGATIAGASVRAEVASALPRYMVPAAVVVLPALPLNANGKVDRRALPAPDTAQDAGAPPTSAAVAGGSLTRIIARVWAEVLGVATVGADDNFFDLGGHSLLLVRVQAGLEEALGRVVPLVTLFQYPTVASLASHLGGDTVDAPAAPVPERAGVADGPVAVIGFAGRFPGAASVDELWNAVREGHELLRRFTPEELTAAGVPPAVQQDARYVPVRGVLAEPDLFDAALFGLSPREAALLDPQQRVLLECAWAALEHAGYGPQTRRTERIGVWAGTSANTYIGQISRAALVEAGPAQVLVSSDKDFLATRVSYKLDLGGPAVTVQTACSTSLVAVHLASQALRAGECEVALAGGVSITVPEGGYFYQPEGIASPDGHCRPFDAAAAGTVAGNGVGLVVLKPLARARADGDTIHAVLAGSAINNDGADKVGFTAPSVHGQAAVVRAAQAAAGLTPAQIGYVEAHGTGTALGDPIEVAALRQVWGDAPGPVGLSSVKGSVGHLDAAAGVTGLLTAIQAVRTGEIPATAHFTRPNPQLDLGPFTVAATPRPWPTAGVRRAGVSSFGMGGTNAHVVLEQAPEDATATAMAAPAVSAPDAHPAEAPLGAWQVVPVSGHAPAAVADAAARLADAIEHDPSLPLADVAWTQQVGRAALSVRRVAVGTDAATVAAALRTARDHVVRATPPVVWMCPGQGTALLEAGAALYQQPSSAFRAELDACAADVQTLVGVDLRAVLYPQPEQTAWATSQLATTLWTQLGLVAVGLALGAQWRAWGVMPAAVVGHSVGEITAAALTGVLSRRDALHLAAARGQAMGEAPAGGMLAVLAGEADVHALLADDLWLAAVNRTTQCVVAGAEAALVRAEAACAARGLATQRLATAGAFHSGLMVGATAPIAAAAATLRYEQPRTPWISSVTARPVTRPTAEYWGEQVMAPVRWADAVSGVAAHVGAPAVWLELGPGRTLTHLVRGSVEAAATVASLDAGAADESLARAVAAVWSAGVSVDWPALHGGARPRRRPLPTYPFQRQRYWLAGTAGERGDLARLFEKNADTNAWYYRPSWSQAAPLPAGTAVAQGRVLVFADGLGLADRLCEALSAEGHDVRRADRGPRFEVLERGHDGRATRIAFDDGSPADYERLLREVVPSDAPFTIVHAASLADQSPEPARGLNEPEVRRRGFESLLRLARALAAVPAGRIGLHVITSGVFAVTGAEPLAAVNATIVGPARVLPHELPHVSATQIDLLWPESERERRLALRLLLAELRRTERLPVVAHRGTHRFVPAVEPVSAASPEAGAARLRPRGVYLITGGLGGVGLVVADLLARTVQARLVLVGRSALPPRSEWDSPALDGKVRARVARVRALEAAGAEVMVAGADVASAAQMQAVLDEVHARFGPVNGVVHAAGVAGVTTMARKRDDEAAAVLAPKVTGTIVLDQLLAADDVDFMVLCSSLTALVGGAGQADYCAANAFLDAYAQRRWCLGDDRVISIDWDTWREAGMAVDIGVPADVAWRRAMALDSGLGNAEGQIAFLRALGTRLPQVAVCTKDLRALAAAMAAPAAPRQPEPAEPPVVHPRPELSTRYVAPERDGERRVCSAFERALGVAEVGVHDNFFELGGHSLLAVDLMAQLNRQFGTSVPVAALYEGFTPAFLAQLFDQGASVADGQRVDEGTSRRREKVKRPQVARRRESRVERRQQRS